MKKPTCYRLTPEAIRLLQALAESLGLTKTSTLEVAIREAAKRENIT